MAQETVKEKGVKSYYTGFVTKDGKTVTAPLHMALSSPALTMMILFQSTNSRKNAGVRPNLLIKVDYIKIVENGEDLRLLN